MYIIKSEHIKIGALTLAAIMAPTLELVITANLTSAGDR